MNREEQIEKLAAVIEEDTGTDHISARRAARRILDLGPLEVIRIPTRHYTAEDVELLQRAKE